MRGFIRCELVLCVMLVTHTFQQDFTWKTFSSYEYQIIQPGNTVDIPSYSLSQSFIHCVGKAGASLLSIHNASEERFIAGLVRNKTNGGQGVWLGLDYKNNSFVNCSLNWSWRDGSMFGDYERGKIISSCDNNTRNIRLVVNTDSSTTWTKGIENDAIINQWAVCKRLIPCASNPCLNNGACNYTDEPYKYTCTCSPGYSGANCESGSSITSLPTSILPTSVPPSTTPPNSSKSASESNPKSTTSGAVIGLSVVTAISLAAAITCAIILIRWKKAHKNCAVTKDYTDLSDVTRDVSQSSAPYSDLHLQAYENNRSRGKPIPVQSNRTAENDNVAYEEIPITRP